MNPRRILFVTPSYAPFQGGSQAFLNAMAVRLARSGLEPAILTTVARTASDFWRRPSTDLASLRSHEELDGVTIHRLSLAYPWPAPYTFGIIRRSSHILHSLPLPDRVKSLMLSHLGRCMPPLPTLAAALSKLAPWADLIQAADSSWDGLFVAAARAARAHGKPFVAVPLMHLGDPAVAAHFQMAHQVHAYRGASAVVALSQREAATYLALGVRAERIHTLAMGVEAAGFPSPGEIQSFRRQHGIGGPMVAFLGANTFDKGAFTLAEAVARLNQAGTHVALVSAGTGGDLLERFVQNSPVEMRRALAGCLHQLGPVSESEKHLLLAACDLLALPSRVDAFGIVFLEAWVHAKPVVGAHAGGIPDLVQDGVNGLLVPFGDSEALAAAIGRLLADRELAERLGRSGQLAVLERYTWDHTYRAWLEILAQAGAERSTAAC